MVLCAPFPSWLSTWNLPMVSAMGFRLFGRAYQPHAPAWGLPRNMRRSRRWRVGLVSICRVPLLLWIEHESSMDDFTMTAETLDTDRLEQLTRTYGQEMFARASQRSPLLFTPGWWDDRMMDWTMHDEVVKVQLFRFIDALPQLRSAESITRHLREYFVEAREH